MSLYKVTDYLSQFFSTCNTIAGLIPVRFRSRSFPASGLLKNEIIVVDVTY